MAKKPTNFVVFASGRNGRLFHDRWEDISSEVPAGSEGNADRGVPRRLGGTSRESHGKCRFARGAYPISRSRRGGAAVEFAVVCPLLLLLFVGAVDVGRAILVKQKLTQAARAGARLYTVKEEVSVQAAREMVDRIMREANLRDYAVQFDPPPETRVSLLAPVEVSVSIPYDRACWLAGSWFLRGRTLAASCVMPADSTVVPSKKKRRWK